MNDHPENSNVDLTNLTPSPDVPQSLFTLVVFLLNRAAKNVVEQLEQHIEPHNLKAGHYVVLMLLSQVEALSQKDIGERLRIDRNAMVHIVDDLERLGYVERVRDQHDRRYYAISITGIARHMLPEVGKVIAEAENQFMSRLTQSELEQLRSILGKLI